VAHTDKVTVVAVAIKNLILANKSTLGLADVFFGQHNMIPRSPTAVVMSGTKRRELAGVSAPGGRTMNYLPVFIDVHSSRVGTESEEEKQLVLENIADSIEFLLHQDPTLGGIIIHGFVQSSDPGITFIGNSQFNTVRLAFEGKTKTYLSNPLA